MTEQQDSLVNKFNDVWEDVLDLKLKMDSALGDMREIHAKLIVGKVNGARSQLDRWTNLEQTTGMETEKHKRK